MKSVGTLAIRGMIAPKPTKKLPSSTTGFANRVITSGITNPARKVIRNYNSNYNSNQPSLKDLVLGQVKINESLTKKLTTNDKILENINSQIEGLTSTVKN